MKRISQVLLWLAVVGLLMPQAGIASAAEASLNKLPTTSQTTRVVDITLSDAHILSGQLVDGQGVGKADQQVRILSGATEVAQATTNPQGGFRVRIEKGGLYTLTDGEAAALVRVWTSEAAPPTAKEALLVVSDPDITRAALGDGGLDALLGLAAVIAVTGGVIWALADDDDGS